MSNGGGRAGYLRRRKTAGLITLVALFGLLAGTLAFTNINDSTTTSASGSTSTTATTVAPTTTTLDPTKLPPTGQDLYALIQSSRANQYHVHYQLSGASVPTTATSATLEIWRVPGQIRQETLLVEPTGITRSVNIGGPSGTVTCSSQPNVALVCQQVSTTALQPQDDYLASITDRLAAATSFTVNPTTIAGIAARCYVLDDALPATRAEACFTDAAVPMKLDTNGLVATADLAEDVVDPSVFVPPAPVSGAPTIESTVVTAPPEQSSS
jgi:hypothetical protein